MVSSLPAECKPYNQLDYFRQIIRAYQGQDEDAVKYVKKVKALINKPLDRMIELEDVRLAMAKVKCPHKLDISVFYQLTRRLPHKDLNYDDERILIHFYYTFYNEPNADLFQFMKGPSHQRTEEEIELVFKNLGWNYSLLCGAQGPPVPVPALASKISLSPSTHNL